MESNLNQANTTAPDDSDSSKASPAPCPDSMEGSTEPQNDNAKAENSTTPTNCSPKSQTSQVDNTNDNNDSGGTNRDDISPLVQTDTEIQDDNPSMSTTPPSTNPTDSFTSNTDTTTGANQVKEDTKPSIICPEYPPVGNEHHSTCQFKSDKIWLDCQFNEDKSIKKPNDIENDITEPDVSVDESILSHIQGSMIGMALGDALGAHVEFRPRSFLEQHPVKDLEGGGTWGLKKGQFTDDTSMALCLANSLLARKDLILYDQLVRYKWWFKHGYMSSTGHCFDIGAATSQSLREFEYRQEAFAKKYQIPYKDLDYLSDEKLLEDFDVNCSEDEVAGNGALMRLAPVPLFFFQYPEIAVEFSGLSGKITHGDRKAYDACRYYGALIVAALRGYTKEQLLDNDFYTKHEHWFMNNELHPDIKSIAHGSYKKSNGYIGGIRGKGYIVNALEAALWAFWSDENSFEKGALAAVNLGDDTDTTAAIYGQLAGAYYKCQNLPPHWVEQVYAKKFMEKLSKWILYEGNCWYERFQNAMSSSPLNSV